jgi:hypothetical protein
MDTWARRRRLLALERRWLAHFRPEPPVLTARDLVQGEAYLAVFHHRAGCMLHAWGRCGCRPAVQFFAAERSAT